MTNSEFIKIIDKLFKEINVTYKILQYKKIDNKKFYPGYIYIDNMEQLTDEQNQFINDYIYPIFMDNDWEILFTEFDTRSYEQIKEEEFPLVETD